MENCGAPVNGVYIRFGYADLGPAGRGAMYQLQYAEGMDLGQRYSIILSIYQQSLRLHGSTLANTLLICLNISLLLE